MQSALCITTKVLFGNQVEVQLPSDSQGQLDPQNPTALLSKMAEDLDIQSELTAINTEFEIAKMDGLVIE
jgi:hypothetical protein